MRVIEDVDFDIDMAQTKEDKNAAVQAKESKTWLMLRLSAKSKFSAFDRIEDGKNLKSLFEAPQSAESTAQPTTGTPQESTTKASQENEPNESGQDRELDTEPANATVVAESKPAITTDTPNTDAPGS
jgi:THO complex subunit 1